MSTAIQVPKSEFRRRKYAQIKLTWRELRGDLAGDREELRNQLLVFAAAELGIQPIGSLTDLTDGQLKRVAEALQREKHQPRLPGQSLPEVKPAPITSGEVIHLASQPQQFTINKLFAYLRWSSDYREQFLREKYRRNSPAMLSTKQAHGCIRLLLNFAAYRDLKEQRGGDGKIPQRDAVRYLTELKRKLGIGQKKQEGEQ